MGSVFWCKRYVKKGCGLKAACLLNMGITAHIFSLPLKTIFVLGLDCSHEMPRKRDVLVSPPHAESSACSLIFGPRETMLIYNFIAYICITPLVLSEKVSSTQINNLLVYVRCHKVLRYRHNISYLCIVTSYELHA